MHQAPKPLVITRMDGPEDAAQESLECPTWNDVETAIRRLDGDRCTMLMLSIGDEVPHMGIGGGQDGKYIVYATQDNQSFHTLIDPNAPPGKCFLVAGGQLGDYENRLCVGLAQVLRAARIYAETAELDSNLIWES